jgi:hypothetical protein
MNEWAIRDFQNLATPIIFLMTVVPTAQWLEQQLDFLSVLAASLQSDHGMRPSVARLVSFCRLDNESRLCLSQGMVPPSSPECNRQEECSVSAPMVSLVHQGDQAHLTATTNLSP